MKDFFKNVFFTGLKIFAVLILVWLIYFTINFFSPHFFDVFRSQNKNDTNATSTTIKEDSNNKGFGYRIYSLFFKGNNSSTTNTKNPPKKSLWGENATDTTYVWGEEGSSVWGQGGTVWGGGSSLAGAKIYLLSNINKSPIQNMKINNILVNNVTKPVLFNGSMISGTIYSGFQSQYYFNIEVYKKDETWLFSIPTTSVPNKSGSSDFKGVYNGNYNYDNYKGEGYLVIHSDNPNIESVVVIKITIK